MLNETPIQHSISFLQPLFYIKFILYRGFLCQSVSRIRMSDNSHARIISQYSFQSLFSIIGAIGYYYSCLRRDRVAAHFSAG